MRRLQFTADGEENERSDGNVRFYKSAIVCTGVKEPQVHLAVFSTQMNLIELIVLGLLGLGANKEEGRFCGFLKSAEEPQSWLKLKPPWRRMEKDASLLAMDSGGRGGIRLHLFGILRFL